MRPSLGVRSAISAVAVCVALLGGCRGILGIDDVSLRDDDGVVDGSDESTTTSRDGSVDARVDASVDAAIDPFSGPVCSTDHYCWQNPLPQGNALRALWSASAKEVWSVGDYGTVLKYDGTHWGGYSRDPNESFVGIAGDKKGRLWIAGSRSGTPLLLTSPTSAGEPTGHAWAEVAFPIIDGGTVAITPTSVWYDGTSKLYVGGAGLTTTSRLLSYDVTTKMWTPIATTENVRSVWGRSPADVWAVGDNNSVERFTTATGWMPVTTNVNNNPVWRGVSGTSSLTYITGGTSFQPMVLEIGAAGPQLANVTTPDNNNVQLQSVAVSPDGAHAFVAATFTNNPSVILERDGITGAWSPVTSTGDVGDGLFAVASADGDAWAVGTGGAIAHRTASWTSGFRRVKLGVDDYGHHIAIASPSDAWVAGDLHIARFGPDGGAFDTADSGPPVMVTGLQDVGAELWMTSRSGLRTRSAAGVWTIVPGGGTGPTINDMSGLWANSTNEAVIIGSNNDATRLRTGTWSAVQFGTGFSAIWASGMNDYWAVGAQCCDNPRVYHLAGTLTWTDATAAVVSNAGYRGHLYAVWGRSANEIFIAGLSEDPGNNSLLGQVFAYNGATWQPTVLPVPAGDTMHYSVRSIHGLMATTDLWAGGIPRYLWHKKPASWELLRTGTTESITSIQASAVDDVWIAGTGGVVLRRR